MYSKFSINYDEWAKRYDPANHEISLISSLCNIRGTRVIDLGCGTGRFTFRLAEYANEVIGLDNDQYSIDICLKKNRNLKYKNNCKFINEDIETLNINETFDIVAFSWSLYQCNNMEKAIQKAKRIMKEQGRLIILHPYGGMQEEIFDIENIQKEISLNDLLIKQEELCFKNFVEVKVFDLISYFKFKSVNEAIRLNDFFYILTTGKSLYDDKLKVLELQNKLSPFLKQDCIHLSDIVKVITCKQKIRSGNEI